MCFWRTIPNVLIESVSILLLLFSRQIVIQCIPEMEKTLEILRGERLDFTMLKNMG